MNHDSSVDTRTDLSSITEATVCEIKNKKINSEGFLIKAIKDLEMALFEIQKSRKTASSIQRMKPQFQQQVPYWVNQFMDKKFL